MLKFINVFILQWFFVRLTRCTQKVVNEFDMTEVSALPNGDYGVGGKVKIKTCQWFSIQYWVVPCTGWWNHFKYIGSKPKFWKISKETIV